MPLHVQICKQSCSAWQQEKYLPPLLAWATWCTGVCCKHSWAAVSHGYSGTKTSSARTAQPCIALMSLEKRHQTSAATVPPPRISHLPASLGSCRLEVAATCCSVRSACRSPASSLSHRADDKTVCGWDPLLRKTWGPPKPKAELQGESSVGMLTSRGLRRLQLWAVSRWKGLRNQYYTLLLHLGSRTRGAVLWFCSWEERSGKLAWTPACTRAWALSSIGTCRSCYANLKQLVLLLVYWARHSLIHFKREGKRMTVNICF